MAYCSQTSTTAFDPSGHEDSKAFAAPGKAKCLLLLILPIFVVVLAGMGWMGLAYLVGVWQWSWMSQIIAAASLTAIGGFLGSTTVVMTWSWWPDYLPQGVLAAVAVRLLATLGGLLAIALILPSMRTVFFFGVAVFYVIGLMVETALSVMLIRPRSAFVIEDR